MILLNLTLGSRNNFLPESHLLQMIACCTRRFRSYSPMFFRDPVPIAFAIPYHRYIPMDKYIHLLFLPLFPAALVITRYTENFSLLFREYFVATALQFFATRITL